MSAALPDRPWTPRRRRRQVISVVAVLVGLATVVAAGWMVPPQTETVRPPPQVLVGRTSAVCAAASENPAATTVTAVAVRQAPEREGVLSAGELGTTEPPLRLTEQGKAVRLDSPALPVVLRGEGVMATAGSGATLSTAETGVTAGLMSATCVPPATSQWFVGVGAEPGSRTDLVLTNPSDTQAVVDLRFYGSEGIVVVPGSPAVVVEAAGTRTVALEPIVDAVGPLTVHVRASEGRVAVQALDQRSVGPSPAGADWHPASTPPRRAVVIPNVPEGEGERQLVVTNPGRARSTVSVEVLGLQGAFTPVGAEQVEVAPESTATLDLEAGLAGLSGTVRLTSDRPVTAAVVAGSSREGAQPDFAVLASSTPLAQVAVAAVATTDGTDSEVLVSNSGDTEARVGLEVLTHEGVSLRTDEVLLAPGAASRRRLTSPGPTYLVLSTPEGSAVRAGVVLRQSDGLVAGLTVLPVASPDAASRAPAVRRDPGVAR